MQSSLCEEQQNKMVFKINQTLSQLKETINEIKNK